VRGSHRLVWALIVAVAASAASAATPSDAGALPRGWELKLREFVFSKMDYDRTYFARVLALNAQGKWDASMTREKFKSEVGRASANMPVLDTFAREKERYLAGKPFTLVAEGPTYRTYANLIAILNMLQAFQREDYAAVVAAEKRVVLREVQDLGVVREQSDQYYLGLQRQYFYLQAAANFHLGHDAEAVRWLNRLESDAEVLALKKKLTTEAPVESAAAHLAALRLLPMAVMPFENLDGNKEVEWVSKGMAEVLTADLTQLTSMVLVERSQAAKVLGEASLALRGITDEKNAARLGQLLNADTLLLGSYKYQGPTVTLSVRLVDAKAGSVLEAASADVTQAEVFKEARRLSIQVLSRVGWVSEDARTEAASAPAPKADIVRDLVRAQALPATQHEEAKALYAKAIREDPTYANLFADLKAEFKDVSAAVAVLPLVNVSGNKDDAWMAAGAAEALTADLPKLHFSVVERTRLKELLSARLAGQMLASDEAQDLGKQVGADFVVMGSVLHQAPKIRADVRFVEVRTGVVAAAVGVEVTNDDFMALLQGLTTHIAARFNEKLSEQTLDQLVAKKTSREDFEKYVRQELARESLAKNVSPAPNVTAPSRAPFWIATGGAVVGAAAAVVGLALAGNARASAFYYDGLQQVSVDPARRADFLAQRDAAGGAATAWSVVAWCGVGVTAVSLGVLIWDVVTHRAPASRLDVVPTVGVAPGAVTFGLTRQF
jgi:TolB-like protein